MPKWTKEQQQAIDARNRTILVSAAAGSGKTAVLIERIVQLIREGAKVNRMLIVTFTKAAAGEMRQRLSKRLAQEAAADPVTFLEALDDLEATEISTIHAFCQKVLRNHFEVVGIDPMMRACDTQLRQNLFDEAWLEAFNQLLDEGDQPDFLDLADAWDQPKLMEMTAQLHDFLMSLPAPFDWLRHAIDHLNIRPFASHPWFVTLQNHTKMMIDGLSQILISMRDMLDEPDAVPQRMEILLSDGDACAQLIEMPWNRLSDVLSALSDFKLERMSAVRGLTDEQKEWQKRFSKLRDDIKQIVKEALQALTIDEDRLEREFRQMQKHLRGLEALTARTDMLFLKKKAEKYVIDFSDMEQFTMQVLSDPGCREQIQGEYDHIFVDECQDVSQIQDAILQSVHSENNCMFMVGDVKQSIYRFRKADPTLFLHRMRTYSDDPEAETRRIILQKNFRSRNYVLEATNMVFRETMRPAVTELTYHAEDELICGRETENDPPVEMHLLDISPDEDGEKAEALACEAKVVVTRIRELLKETFDDGKGPRNYTYRDMVILLSAAASTAPKLVEMLGAEGIPVFYDGASAYYELPEVQTIKALLSVMDNPRQDVALLAVMKMPPFVFSEQELALIRLAKTGRNVPFHEALEACCAENTPLAQKCRDFQEQLASWRFDAEVMRLSDLVWHVIRTSGYYAACGALPEGELRQANLRMLYQRAMEFEQNGGETLADFIDMMEQQASGDDRTTAKILGEGENLVRIMTMHKSKGLEFPVVFCMQMSGRLHKPYRGEVLMHPALGVALPYVNREMNVRRKTLADDAFRIQRELDEKAERARLLYVAMTRARERLILIGCCTKKERKVWTLPESEYRVWKASSMTDWIMQGQYAQNIHNLSTNDKNPATPWKFCVYDDAEPLAVERTVDNSDVSGWVLSQVAEPYPASLADWQHMDDPVVTEPLKTSVSAVARHAAMAQFPLTDEEEDITLKRESDEAASPLRLSELPACPQFLEEKQITGAERGTLIHRLLSLMPVENLRAAASLANAVHQAAHDMMERGIFTPQELLMLDLRGATAWFESPLGQRMLKARRLRREWNFNLVLDDAQTSLLQGVIDCAFLEADGWVIVDYKTDRIEDEAAFLWRYEQQIGWYARAVERITGLPVKETWLYAIGRRKAYAVAKTKA